MKNGKLKYTVMSALSLTAVVAALSGCDRNASSELCTDSHTVSAQKPNPTTHVDIPHAVRQNLGITFVKVESRPVRTTMRIAGQFELRPEARREYHVMLSGRIELLVNQYQRVQTGTPLFHLDSPEWQTMQRELASSLSTMKRSHAELEVAQANLAETQQAVEFVEGRIAKLAEAQVRRVELEAELIEKQNAIPRLEAQLRAAKLEFDAAHTRYQVVLNTAASLTGIPRNQLDRLEHDHHYLDDHNPQWSSIQRITVHAEAPGVVDRIPVTNKGWAATGDLVLDTVSPSTLRFHADALQTDINLFRDGQPACIVPPQGGSFQLQDTIEGIIEVGFEAHPQQRTIPIYLVPRVLPRWAKAGVTAYLEVFIDGTADPVLAIPEATVIRDGLEKVFFRRDPNDPDKVRRVTADLGINDGRWIEVKSGVRLGDEIVLGGVYPLMLASSSSGEIMEGGHFHGDGTFHENAEH